MIARSVKSATSHSWAVRCLVVALCLLAFADGWAETVPMITPLPQKTDADPQKARLGELLFNDPRLSRDDRLACATCHQLEQGGDDNLPRSLTNNGDDDVINAPTVFNAVFNFRQTWAGKYRTLEAQAESAIRNPRHGNTDWPVLLPKLKKIPAYLTAFDAVYPERGIQRDTVLDAIAVFERTLITPNAPFDLYLTGDAAAIGIEAKKGFALFKIRGCTSCHQGRNVGGSMFQKIGIYGNYLAGRTIDKADRGRIETTGKDADRHVFRVPSLRNVAVTAPYFHDGAVETLEEAVHLMGQLQLGTNLPQEEVALIIAFLRTLTGKYKGESLDGSAGR